MSRNINKTAMMELIEWVQSRSPINPSSVLSKATELLQKEKEIIVDAYDNAQRHMVNIVCEKFMLDKGGMPNSKEDAKKYYNQTFIND